MSHTHAKSFYLSLFLSFIGFLSFSQNAISAIDSLYYKLYDNMYTDKDSAYYYSNLIISKSKLNQDYRNLLHGYVFLSKSAAYFNDFNTIKSNIKNVETIFDENKNTIDSIPGIAFIKNSLNYDKAVFYYKMNDYEAAHNSLITIIKQTEKLPDSINTKPNKDIVNVSYALIAKMYSNDGKYDLARQYYDKNKRYVKQEGFSDSLEKINTIDKLIGEVYKRENDYETSNNYFKKSFDYTLNYSPHVNSITTEANNIAENYLALNKLDSAALYLEKIKPLVNENNPYSFLYYKTEAKLNSLLNNTEKAAKNYTIAIDLTQEKWQNLKNIETAELYLEYSKTLKNNKLYEAALQKIDSGILQVTHNNISNSSINNVMLLKLLKEKAFLHKKTEDHTETIKTVNKALVVLDSLKPSFESSADKIMLIENAYPIFESGIEAAYYNYKKSNDETYIDLAFRYNEKGKSVLLLEALLTTKATTFASIPESISVKEKLLKEKISRLEKSENTNKIPAITDSLFDNRTKYRSLIKTIETNYKSYYDLKYNSNVASLKGVQKFLKKDDVLISYFYGEKSLFIISISKNKKHFTHVVLNKEIENLVKEVYVLLNNPKSDLQLLDYKSFELYMHIADQHLNYKNKKNLMILADGLLNYIPFAALTTNESNYSYLVEDYAISYANSATLLLQLQERKQNNNNVLAFAPSFSNGTLLSLPNNKKEAQNVLSHFSGDLFSDANATLENFNSNNSKYSILHLATHAIYNDKTPEYSYLAFTSEDNKENSLYVRDLYNLKLNADLVTLSACESGIGKLNRGEGLMSLARGFYFSGANSISSTLWKVNDASSTELMDGFYKALSEHKNKNRALQEAQLNFLKTNSDNKLSHPYYWSGFIVSGNTNSIQEHHYILYSVICALILLLLYFFFKRKKA